jgi:hypothetical protein
MPFTHIRNLPGILRAGSIQSDSMIRLQAVGIVEAADPAIKARRRRVGMRLIGTVEAVAAAGLQYLFSDGNCAARVTQMFGDLCHLDDAVDWDLMRARMWNDTADDPDRMRRRMAEFLVYERVPVRLQELVVRTASTKREAEAILAAHRAHLPVSVRGGWGARLNRGAHKVAQVLRLA